MEGYVFADESSSPDSERFHSMDVDSGNSTAHSPDGPKSMSPQLGHQGEFRRHGTSTALLQEGSRKRTLLLECGKLSFFKIKVNEQT